MKLMSRSLGELWLEALDKTLYEGDDTHDGPNRQKELCCVNFTLDDISKDEKIGRNVTQDRLDTIYKKYRDVNFVHHTDNYGDPYEMNYAKRIYENNGVNQIEYVIDELKRRRRSPDAFVTMHNGEEFATGRVPCLTTFGFHIRPDENGEDVLNMMTYYRSQNALISIPGNYLVLRSIQQDVADELDVPIGHLHGYVKSLHIYEQDFDTVQNLLQQESCTDKIHH